MKSMIPHLIAVFLIVVAPIWDVFETRRLKASADPRVRVKWYAKVLIASWTLALLAIVATGWREIWNTAETVSWLPRGEGVKAFLIGLLAALLAAQLVPVVMMRSNEKLQARVRKALSALYFILPVTREERWWWVVVGLTAGFCEEVLYRGFLIRYFQGAPLQWSLSIAIAGSIVAFGMGHSYQGIRGVVGTAILGAVFAVLFLMTGSLLVPVLLHAFVDVRILLIVPEGLSLAPARESESASAN
jgi:membrane protease YdiL (CAAX protease family)